MAEAEFPKVSFVIPTLNAGGILGQLPAIHPPAGLSAGKKLKFSSVDANRRTTRASWQNNLAR